MNSLGPTRTRLKEDSNQRANSYAHGLEGATGIGRAFRAYA
jgi:hypothetical protein